MAYYFWHGLDFQGSRVSGAFKVPKRIDAIKKLRNKGIFRSRLHEISPYRLKSPVPLTQLVSILIQLERLQKSGFPLNRSLQFIVSETVILPWLMHFVKSARICNRVTPSARPGFLKLHYRKWSEGCWVCSKVPENSRKVWGTF